MSLVKIYTTDTCKYCQLAKDYFKSNSIEYKEYNVAEDMEARSEMVKVSGQMSVPVISIDENIIIGFNKDEIDKVLGLVK